jgi:hypothetical protein
VRFKVKRHGEVADTASSGVLHFRRVTNAIAEPGGSFTYVAVNVVGRCVVELDEREPECCQYEEQEVPKPPSESQLPVPPFHPPSSPRVMWHQ